jgi:2-dehydropantoate 2-reductase
MRGVMNEGIRVGEAYGVQFQVTADQRLQMTAERIGSAKVSMLQDLERGRQVESEAIVGAVCELGRRVGIPTPVTDIIYTLISQRAKTHSAMPDGNRL